MSTHETGHDTNVGNLEVLISNCTGFGSTYNPSKVSIKLPGLNALLTASQGSNTTVSDKKNLYTVAVDGREILFNPLSPLTTRILNALESSEVTKQIISDAKTYTRKITGKRATPKAKQIQIDPNGSVNEGTGTLNASDNNTPSLDPKEISASQLSFDNRMANLARLINLLSSEPGYNPNEADLKVTALNSMLASMKLKNTAVINAATALANSRLNRNKILYKDGTGLFDITIAVKAYVKSVYGASSPEFKLVSKIKFTKPR
ncbi:MAG: hypothetical protein HXX09_17050 [Bacteroidetes bacterium]|nr:hypothetical protein [Bacteroidota bacterium]